MRLAAHKDPAPMGPMPTPGQRVWIEEIPAGPFEVCVEQIDDVIVRTDHPRVGGVEIPLREGTRLALSYNVAEVPCLARARVVLTPPGRPDGLWLVVRTVERMQRRHAVRVPLSVMVRVECEPAGIDELAVSEDISATGVLLRSDHAIDARSDVVRVTLFLGEVGVPDFVLAARIARMTREARPVDRPWQVGLRFVDLERPDEERLTRLVFERQRELRKRATGRD